MKLKPIPKCSFKVNEIYPYNVYLQVNETKVIKIYNANFNVSPEDIDRLIQYPDNRILVSKDDYTKFFETQAPKILSENLAKDSPVDEKLAKELLCYALFREDNLSDSDYVKSIVKKTEGITKEIFSFQGQKEQFGINNILSHLCKSEDIFAAHSQLTMALGSLFMMVSPNTTADEINTIGQVSFLHGFGMDYLYNPQNKSVFHKILPSSELRIDVQRDSAAIKKSIDLHFDGHSLSDFNSISAYLKHFYVIEKVLERSSFGKNPAIVRTFKELKYLETPPKYRIDKMSSNYFIVTKKFIIIDHLCAQINKVVKGTVSQTENLIDHCISSITQRSGSNDINYEYDTSLLTSLSQISRAR